MRKMRTETVAKLAEYAKGIPVDVGQELYQVYKYKCDGPSGKWAALPVKVLAVDIRIGLGIMGVDIHILDHSGQRSLIHVSSLGREYFLSEEEAQEVAAQYNAQDEENERERKSKVEAIVQGLTVKDYLTAARMCSLEAECEGCPLNRDGIEDRCGEVLEEGLKKIEEELERSKK